MAKQPVGGALVEESVEEFTDWLGKICEAGNLRPPKLHFFLAREGYECREESVRRWMQGTAQPPARAIPHLLRALQRGLPPGINVRAHFEAWLDGRPFRRASRGSGARSKKATKRRFEPSPRGAGEKDRIRTPVADRHLTAI